MNPLDLDQDAASRISEWQMQRLDRQIICIRRILNMINDPRNGFMNLDMVQEYIAMANMDQYDDDLFPGFYYNPDDTTTGSCSRNECSTS